MGVVSGDSCGGRAPGTAILFRDQLTTTPTTSVPLPYDGGSVSRRRSIVLVAACTVFGAAAQILIKVGMARLVIPERHDWISWLAALAAAFVTNLPLFSGYALYGLNTILLVLALREGELSMLYPIIALTYVWVTLLSYALLHEAPNLYKNAGIATIVIGVAVLGRGKPLAGGQDGPGAEAIDGGGAARSSGRAEDRS